MYCAAPSRGTGPALFDSRLPIKVLLCGSATGLHSSRGLDQACCESLPYLFLTRGDTPSYKPLCRTRLEYAPLIEQVWIGWFAVAERCGRKRNRHREKVEETVFGFTRGTLGHLQFLLQGKERVEREGRLMQVAYQVRKVHGAWVGA